MKTKKMTPATVAPVQRENAATVSRDDGSAIAPHFAFATGGWGGGPFAGDEAE